MIRDVSFLSDGGRVMAHMVEPDAGQQNGAAVILCPDYGMTKEVILAGRLSDLARAGFVLLAIDYRFTGSSGGEPHAQVLPSEQVDDVRRAVTFLHREAAIQQVGLLGVGLGGGVALQAAAFDDRVGAVVAVSPVTDGLDWIRSAHGAVSWRPMAARLNQDHDSRALAGYCEYVAAVGSSGNALLPVSDRMRKWFSEWQSTFPTVRRHFALRSLQAISEFHPQTFATLLAGRATCLIASAADTFVPMHQAVSFWHRCTEPRRFSLVPPELNAEHCDLLDGEAGTFVLTEAVGWMTNHLVSRGMLPSLRASMIKAHPDEVQNGEALHRAGSVEVAAAQARDVLSSPSAGGVTDRDTETAPPVPVEEHSDERLRTQATEYAGQSPDATIEQEVAPNEHTAFDTTSRGKTEQDGTIMVTAEVPVEAASEVPPLSVIQPSDPALFQGTGAEPAPSEPEPSTEPTLDPEDASLAQTAPSPVAEAQQPPAEESSLTPEPSTEPTLVSVFTAQQDRAEWPQHPQTTESEVSWSEGAIAAIQEPTSLPTVSDESILTAQTQTAASEEWREDAMGTGDNGSL